MSRRTKFGSATWKCSRCGMSFTRIAPEAEVKQTPETCHGCAVRYGEDGNEHLRRRKMPRKLHA